MTDKFLTRREAAEYLNSKGLPIAHATLGKLASVGGGPLYCRFGRVAVYKAADLDDWAARKLGTPHASTSDAA